MDGRAACGAHGLVHSSGCTGTGPGEGTATKNGTRAVAQRRRAGNQLENAATGVRKGDRLTGQGLHCPIANLLSLCLEFSEPIVILTHADSFLPWK